MTIPAIVPPYENLPQGYKVTPEVWNAMFDTIFDYLNTTVKDAVDTLQAGGIPSLGAQGTCQGRLTLKQGDPAFNGQMIEQANLYFTPYKGDQIGLWNGSAWTLRTFSEITIPLTNVLNLVNYDVFIYDNNGVLTGELVEWDGRRPTAQINPGSNVVVNITGGPPADCQLYEPLLLRSDDGNTWEIAEVTNINPGVSVTLRSVTGTYPAASSKVHFNSRATALTQIDGVYVKNGATSRLYVGTIKGSGINGRCTDTFYGVRFVWNYYNRLPRVSIANMAGTASWTYGSTTKRMANNNSALGFGRIGFVVGLQEDDGAVAFYHQVTNSASGAGGIGINTPVGNDAIAYALHAATTGHNLPIALIERDFKFVRGYNYVQAMEWCNAVVTVTFYGDSGSTNRSSVLFLLHQC